MFIDSGLLNKVVEYKSAFPAHDILPYPYDFLCISKNKTGVELHPIQGKDILSEEAKNNSWYLMRGSKFYHNRAYAKYGYQYLVAEKFGRKMARNFIKSGSMVFANKINQDKFSAVYHWRSQDALINYFEQGFREELRRQRYAPKTVLNGPDGPQFKVKIVGGYLYVYFYPIGHKLRSHFDQMIETLSSLDMETENGTIKFAD